MQEWPYKPQEGPIEPRTRIKGHLRTSSFPGELEQELKWGLVCDR